MIKTMAEAATALQNFWLWKDWFSSKNQPIPEERAIIPLISRYDLLLNELILENPMLTEFQLLYVQHVQQLAKQLQQGMIPSLMELANAFPEGTDSPEAKHLLLRYTYFLNQTGKLGRLRGEQLTLLIRLRSRENLLRHMEYIGAKYQADSKEAQELKRCTSHLQEAAKEIEQLLRPLLDSDPSHGGTIHLHWQGRYDWLNRAWHWCKRGFSLSLAPVYLLRRLQTDKVRPGPLLGRSHF
jgi:hypothetical protein